MYKIECKNTCLNEKIFGTDIINLKLNIVFMAIVIGIVGTQGVQANDYIPLIQLKEIGRQIKTAEKEIHNLKVHSEIRIEKNNNPKDPCAWQKTPVYVSSTMWSDGQPEGKIRVDVQKQVLQGWLTDTELGPYSEHSFKDSFDGVTGRSAIDSGGFLGRAVSIKKGDISSQRPQNLNDSWSFKYTGREFTSNFFRLNSKGTLLLDLFNLADDPNSKVMDCFEFTWDKLQRIECIKIATKETQHNWIKRWWIDPARGFALLRYEHTLILKDNTETFRKLIDIQELKEVTEDVWWPIRAICITEPTRSGGDYTRIIYQASDIVANNPNFDESVFDIKFPKGYRVDDKMSGKTYLVDANDNLVPIAESNEPLN